MKITQVINTDFGFIHLLEKICDGILVKGHSIEVICTKTKFWNEIDDKKFKKINFNFTRSFNFFYFLMSVLRMRKLLKELETDILHLHTPSASIIARIALYGLKKKFKIVYTCHAFYFTSRGSSISKLLIFFLEYISSFKTDIFLFQSKSDYNFSLKYFSKKNNSYIIGNGVLPEIFDINLSNNEKKIIKKNININDDKKIIIINARMVREKGYVELINAILNIDCHLIIIGDEDINNLHNQSVKKYLYNFIKINKINHRVHFIGYTKEVNLYLKISDLFVLPTYGEGLNRSIIEALFASLPIITTDIENNKELVKNNYNGILVPVKNIEILEKSIKLILNNERKSLKMSKNSNIIAYKNFNLYDVIKNHIKYINL